MKELLSEWQAIKHDYKQEEFVSQLHSNKLLKDKKIVIFTESAETAANIYSILKDEYGDSVLYYSSGQKDELKDVIKYNYDPNQKEYEQEDKIKLLITTDVLAEGINLHRSNIIVNYDLPWNPTRVLQRVGRVNRVGTKHDKVYIFNFFPTSETDKQLGLENSIIAKIQAFHNALGEDAKYLSEEEEVESYNLRGEQLYRTLKSKETFNEDDEESPELKYISILRNIRDKKTDLYAKIAELPKKIRTAKDYDDISSDSLITFFRKGKLRKFCITKGDVSVEIPFDEAVKYFECEPNEKMKQLPNRYFDFPAKNKELFGHPIDTEPMMVRKGRSKMDKIVKDLKGLLNCPKYTQDEKVYLQTVINAFGNRKIADAIAKKLNNFFENEFDDIKLLAGIKSIVPDIYLYQDEKNKSEKTSQKREIVLSEFLYKKGE